MSQILTVAVDVVAVGVMVFVFYFRRHRRPDMVIAFLGVNIGVMTVAIALSKNTALGPGFGLGLFGALSIIRLRSDELGHTEVAYYFSSLALGLIGGIEVEPFWLVPTLSAAIVVAMAFGDSQWLFGRYRHQTLTLDHAYTDEGQIKEVLENLLKARIDRLDVRRLDQVNDTTVVDVKYRLQLDSGQTA